MAKARYKNKNTTSIFGKNMKKVGLIAIIGIFSIMSTFGQKWPDAPEKRAKAEEMWVLLKDNSDAKNFAAAKPAFLWLYKECPDLIKGLYQYGSKTYEGLEKAETDKTVKAGLRDTALFLYDERIKYFGEEANVLNRKGLKAYNYLVNRRTENDKLYALYSKIYELNGDNSYSSNLLYLQKMMCKMHKAEKLTKDEVLETYGKISETFDKKLEAGKSTDQKLKKMTDDALADCIEIKCEDIQNIMIPKYKANPDDIKLAKQIVGFMTTAKCPKDEIYYQCITTVLKKEPSCGGALGAAKRAKKDNDYSQALIFFQMGLDGMCGEEQKAEILYEMATCHYAKGAKQKAREYARLSIAAGTSHQAASYNLIGDIYLKHVKDCDPQDVLEFRSRYIAAYEMFKKAGNKSKMERAMAQFPSASDIFTANKKVGDSYSTGCWMNETITLQKRAQ